MILNLVTSPHVVISASHLGLGCSFVQKNVLGCRMTSERFTAGSSWARGGGRAMVCGGIYRCAAPPRAWATRHAKWLPSRSRNIPGWKRNAGCGICRRCQAGPWNTRACQDPKCRPCGTHRVLIHTGVSQWQPSVPNCAFVFCNMHRRSYLHGRHS